MIERLLSVLGFPSLSEYILDILDIQDDVEEWLMRWLNMSIGIDQLIHQALLDAVLKGTALYKIDDPVTLMSEDVASDPTKYGGFGPSGEDAATAATVTLAKVAVRVLKPNVEFNDHEMVVTFDFEK